MNAYACDLLNCLNESIIDGFILIGSGRLDIYRNFSGSSDAEGGVKSTHEKQSEQGGDKVPDSQYDSRCGALLH